MSSDQPTATFLLWQQAREGDQQAYERLFARYVDRLLIFVRARLGALREKIEAEDVLQDAYLAAHRAFADFDYTDEGAFFRWMCRIIDHRLRDTHDYFTAKKRQGGAIPPASSPTGPFTALARSENRERLARALAELSEEHRDVLLLRYFEGFSAEETGQRLQRSAGAVRNLAARALAELGKRLATTA